MPDIDTLLQDGADIFSRLRAAYNESRKNNQDRLDHLEWQVNENRETLLAVAKAILERLG